MKKFALIITMILWASSAHAAYWYVDNVATGSNNGTSWANAWKTFASVVWGPGGVQAGDTLWLSGGTGSQIYHITWNGSSGENLTIGASGTSSAPIYIKPGAAHPTLSSGHDGAVIFDCGGPSTGYEWAIHSNGQNYIVIDGSDGSYNIVPIGQNTHRKFKFQNVYIDGKSKTLVHLYNGKGIKFLNSEFATSSYGLIGLYWDTTTGTQSEIAGNYFHDIRGQAAIWLAGSANTNPRYDAVLIHDNEIQVNSRQNDGTGPDGIQMTHGCTIYNNLFYGLQLGSGYVVESQHQDLIQGLGIYHKIYKNIFRNTGSTGVRTEFTDNPGGHWYIYDNIFEMNDSTFFGAIEAIAFGISTPAGGSVSDILIANNTIVDFNGLYGIEFNFLNAGVSATTSYIQNNILYQCGQPGSAEAIRANNAPCGNGVTLDRNLLYKSASYGDITLTCGSTGYVQPTGYLGQPLFVAYSRMTVGNNYHLSSSDTQAKDRGVSFLSYFATDYDNVVRPQGSAWDIGAYEFSVTGTVKKPMSPTLRVN